MKNVLLKFAGLFVEKVPVDEAGSRSVPQPNLPAGMAPTPTTQQKSAAQPQQLPNSPQTPQSPQSPHSTQPAAQAPPGSVAIALRAWVPQEYAAHLAPFGLHVIAAGGSVTPEQARTWGAHVLVISAECLGQDLHLLQQPQMPTVFITPQPVMLPDASGVVQVQEPLRASDVAHAVREARAQFMPG